MTEVDQNKLNVFIRNKDRDIFSGRADTVTSLNDKGEFDILPYHANFISLINNYIYLNKGTEKEQKTLINKGVLRVKENKVDVFLEI